MIANPQSEIRNRMSPIGNGKMNTTRNANLAAKAEVRLKERMAEACQPGCHGKVHVEVTVQDGTLQAVRHWLERTAK